MNDTIINALNWRYATKLFDPNHKISDQDWATLESSLVLTPSSFGLQPWKFLVITADSLKQELLAHSWNQTQVTDCSHYLVILGRTRVDEGIIDEWLAELSKTQDRSLEELSGYKGVMMQFMENMSPEQIVAWSQRQTYIALGQLMTAAALLKIDACPMEGFVPAEYDRILKLSDKGFTSSVCCALGYRREDDKYAQAPKARFPSSQLISHI